MTDVHLHLEVELHIPPAGVVGVFPQDERERRLSLVEVAVLQQVAPTGLRFGDQLVLILDVSENEKFLQRSAVTFFFFKLQLNKLHVPA